MSRNESRRRRYAGRGHDVRERHERSDFHCGSCGGRLVRAHDLLDLFMAGGPNVRHESGLPCPGPRLEVPPAPKGQR